MVNDCTFILLGATGDLARRKLIPALAQLLKQKTVEKLLIVGIGHDMSNAQTLADVARPYSTGYVDDQSWQQLVESMVYQQMDITKKEDVSTLCTMVNQLEMERGLSGRRILYCAVGSSLFGIATHNALTSGLICKKELNDPIWHKVIYEKPFGSDQQSAILLNVTITELLEDHQIFRIDHYLTKGVCNSIATLRFANLIFESLWNAGGIEQVIITLAQTEGVPGRGLFYESHGALRDVVQNHLLTLLSLIAMDKPERLYGDSVRKARYLALKDTYLTDVVLGQCDAYKQENGVRPDSRTETFALLRLFVRNERWAGVSFYLMTGKYLDNNDSSIRIKFRKASHMLSFDSNPLANWLTLNLDAEGMCALSLNIKKPGHTHLLTTASLEFSHGQLFEAYPIRAYQILLDEIIQAESSAAVSIDEIVQAWRIIDHTYAIKSPVYAYQKGTSGPEQANIFAKKYTMG